MRVSGVSVWRTAARALRWSAGATISGSGKAVAALVVAVVEAADLLDGGFGLIAVKEIDRDERVLELRHRRAGLDDVWAEVLERGCAHFENACEFGGRVGAIVPEVRVWLSGAEGARVFVGDEELAGAGRRR